MPVLRLPQLVLAYVATLAAFLAIDAVWLGIVMKQAYAAWLGPLMLAQPKLPAAGLFYLLYVVGLLVFAVMPGLREGSWRATAWRAVLLGLVSYGTYDLTNHATLKDWPLALTVTDLAWGAVLSCLSATAGHAAASRLKA